MVNCIPLNDEQDHARATDCWCAPAVQWQDNDGTILPNGPIIVHNAKDQREVVERTIAEGIPGKEWGVFED